MLVRVGASLLLAGYGAAKFTKLTGVPQDVTSVTAAITYQCLENIPGVQFTIKPTAENEVTVETNPANLVTVWNRAGVLEFSWNQDGSDEANEGGIIITMPEAKLETVTASQGYTVQLLDGFTNVTSLRADSNSNFVATLNSLTTNLKLLSTSNAELRVKTNALVDSAVVEGDAQLYFAAPNVKSAQALGNAKLGVIGDVIDLTVKSSALIGVVGKLTGTGTATGSAELAVSDIVGNIVGFGMSKIASVSCANVAKGDSDSMMKCFASGAPKLNLGIEELATMATSEPSSCSRTADGTETTTDSYYNAAPSLGITSLLSVLPTIFALTA